MRAGFSLVEVAMAFLILGLTILPVIGLFSGAGREAQHTADHTSSLALSAKVAEELRLAAWENQHFYYDVEADPDFGGTQAIVNASSPFFAVLEDDAAPFGRMRAGVDSGIAAGAGALFRELSSHELRVQAKGTVPPPPGRPVDIAIEMAWTDMRGRRQTSSFDAVLPRLVPVPPQPDAGRALADQLIARTLWPGASGTLDAIAARRGADAAVVRDLGDVVVIALGMEETEARYQEDLKVIEREASAAAGPPRARMLSLLQRRLEMRATSRLAAIEYLAPRVGRLAAGFQLARLGTPAPAPDAFIEGVRLAAYLPMDFDWDVCDAIATGRRVLEQSGDALSLRGRTQILMRMVRLAQLLALTAGPDDLAHVREMLRTLQALQDGRNANFHRWARVELSRSQSVAVLRASYARPHRLDAWDAFTRGITDAVQNVMVASGMSPAPPPAGTPAAGTPAADHSPGWTRARTRRPAATPSGPLTQDATGAGAGRPTTSP